ncbi:DUF6265 family protein [Flavobacterium azooxidireducens]|uniref:DUF6265 family protein n=1 Tax=Flavobacterium azooxidireducens TaxID=1871076 RepID=A0ABY4KFN5_9FLAO|nr:DUF6265 family protein [Flavobacterium azooxidireducens]UPQ79625.1 DUF6265 family protein [Flavobacterium azooxidireducens]
MKNIIYIASFLLFCCFSCQQKATTYAELEKVNWFLGKWENKTTEGTFSEEWKVENDSVYYGKSHYVVKNDTIFTETIKLIQSKKNVFYIVTTIPPQNGVEPVSFKLTSSTTDYLVFENPEHDFPKKITYKLVTKDSLYAEISGDGKSQGFPFKKKVN